MPRTVLLVLWLTAMAAGCGRHEPAAPAGEAATGAVPSPRGPIAQPPAPASVVVADTGDEAATLSQLSAELRRYVVRTQSRPANFEDFVAKAHVQAPPAPAGRKYVIVKGEVQLANQ